jgi:exonuclease SbcC
MTLNSEFITKQLSAKYCDFENLSDDILMFRKKYHDRPYAVFYVDVSGRVPPDLETLSNYQDKVIGNRYFEDEKSLQWNNYLYFVTTDSFLHNEVNLARKELLEGDRRYARKFVLEEQNVLSHIDGIDPSSNRSKALDKSVIFKWAEILYAAGIEEAIFEKNSFPSRLKIIEASKKPIEKPEFDSDIFASGDNKRLPFIRKFDLGGNSLNNYREYPLKRKYEFGKFNLIVGKNGVGKTSLLEAIELYYCGKNKRNDSSKPTYKFSVVLANGETEEITNNRSADSFRQRHLRWYSQPELKTNKLYESFSRYNFLDTDAAVSIAKSVTKIEDGLSKLLIGTSASTAWDTIDRLQVLVSKGLEGKQQELSNVDEELLQVNKRINDAESIERNSDKLFAKAIELSEKLGWEEIIKDRVSALNMLSKTLPDFLSVLDQVLNFPLLRSPVTIESIEYSVSELADEVRLLESVIGELKLKQKCIQSIQSDLKKVTETKKYIEHIRKCNDSGLLEICSKVDEMKHICDKYGELALTMESEPEIFDTLSKRKTDTVFSCLEKVRAELEKTKNNEREIKRRYSEHKKLKDESESLYIELRASAQKLINIRQKPDVCPLCNTTHDIGVLAELMSSNVSKSFGVISEDLLSSIDSIEKRMKALANEEVAINKLSKLIIELNLDGSSLKIADSKEVVKKISNEYYSARKSLEELSNQIETLGSKGITLGLFLDSLNSLIEIDSSFGKITPNNYKVYHDDILNRESDLNLLWRQNTDELEFDLSKLSDKYGGKVESVEFVEKLLFDHNESRIKISKLYISIKELNRILPVDKDVPISEIIVDLQTVNNIVTSVIKASNAEDFADRTLIEDRKRQALLLTQIETIKESLEPYDRGLKALDKILNEYSLADAIEGAGSKLKSVIELIFTRIHSPDEFSSIGNDFQTLRRKKDRSEVGLTEISTGQRAAFALSIFLAQNFQLKNAPPVIMLDDPVAHVDDLNSMSFLDYLRDIVLNGERQVFFSTADEKLASLIQKKFDFLGTNEFFRYDLKRENTLSIIDRA